MTSTVQLKTNVFFFGQKPNIIIDMYFLSVMSTSFHADTRTERDLV